MSNIFDEMSNIFDEIVPGHRLTLFFCFKTDQKLSDKIHKTRGIVLKTVKYGDTSLIVSIYTHLFGLQSYMVNGVRTSSKKGNNKVSFFQPATILNMEVYHNSFRQINRIKEYQRAVINDNIFTNVIKNGVALFMVELLSKCLKEPDPNEDLFGFVEDNLLYLNECSSPVMANFPVFFALHLSNFFGFFPGHTTPAGHNDQLFFDMQEGIFTNQLPTHNFYVDHSAALFLEEIAKAMQPSELSEIRANAATRRRILEALENYYMLHVQDFVKLKTLPVLRELML